MLGCKTWLSRGGIRCVICSRCTSRSASWSAPTLPAGRRRSTCTKPPASSFSPRNSPACHAIRSKSTPKTAASRSAAPRRTGGRRAHRRAVRAVPSRRARPRPILARVSAARADRRRARSAADLKDGLLTVTIPKAAGRAARRIDVVTVRSSDLSHDCDVSFLSCVLVAAGFAGGLVLTGRMRTATDSRAEARRDRGRAGSRAGTRADARGPPAPSRLASAVPTSRASPARR